MKRRPILAISVSLLFTLAFWLVTKRRASAPHPANIESEIKDVIHQRLAAIRRGDAQVYESFFDADCVVTGDNGSLVKPANIAGEWASDRQFGFTYTGGDPIDIQVHVYGEVAVASFRTDLDLDRGGQKTFESARFTDVFTRRSGHWLLVVHDEIPIPNARRVAVKVEPNVFDTYAGEYQITPAYIIKVKREGDKLMDQWPGDTGYTEDVPVSETTFVARGESGEAIYVKDQSGKVTHFILRNGAGDLIAKKIK
jgi:ketosteroid isomerase-like protein